MQVDLRNLWIGSVQQFHVITPGLHFKDYLNVYDTNMLVVIRSLKNLVLHRRNPQTFKVFQRGLTAAVDSMK